MKSLFMGIDIGTSGVRAALFDADGNQVSLYHKEYPMICLEPGMGELDPEQVFSSLLEVVKKCSEQVSERAACIEAIGLSTQLFSFLAVDSAGRCLTNVVTWADIRSIHHADLIKEKHDYVRMYNSTGCRAQHPMYPVSKMLWLKDTYPDIYNKTFKFVSIKEYILYRLFGEFVIDYTDASTMGYFNIHTFKWDDYILKDVLGVDGSRFGKAVEITHVLKNMKPEYARQMGIDPATPVAVGSGDGMLANVGCGVFDDTAMSCTIGTSGALRIAVNKPLLDEKQRTWCYCFTKDTWVAGGAINNGGIVLKWLRDQNKKQFEFEAEQAGLGSIYELFDQYADEIRPGCEGLLFLPLLTGERSPGWNASARATIHGLQLIHGNKHIVRAAMEGVMYRMFSVYEVITQINNNVKTIMANGGYVNSDIWLQMQSDIFGKEIAVAGIGEAAVFGAAYTAMAATGAVSSLRQPLPKMQSSKLVKPNLSNTAVYNGVFKNFKELYQRLYEK